MVYGLLIILPPLLGLLIKRYASAVYRRWQRHETGLTGADVVVQLAARYDYQAEVDVVPESLVGFYDERTGTIYMSSEVVADSSVLAVAIGAQMVGYIEQSAQVSLDRWRRGGAILHIISTVLYHGLLIYGIAFADSLALYLGLAAFAISALMVLMLVGVGPFDGSRRALRMLAESKLLRSTTERNGVRAVLLASVASFVGGYYLAPFANLRL